MKKLITLGLLVCSVLLALQPNTAMSQSRNRATRTHGMKKAPTERKECNITGAIRYHFNDAQGYKSDLGAEVRFIPASAVDSVRLYAWRWFESKAHRVAMVKLGIKDLEDDGIYMDAEERRSFYKNHDVSEKDEAKLMKVNAEILYDDYRKLMDSAEYIAIIDANGTYSLSLPYGEYYVLIKSKNRARSPYLTEILGCTHVESIELNSPVKILSHDFDY